MGSLPHPSKLTKRKQKSSKSLRSARHNQCGFDVGAHVAQLKRKHAEFNWLPSHSRDDITSPSSAVDEEPFPARSIGPQCVPGTPTLGTDDFYELQSDNSEWPLRLPTFRSSESAVLDFFLDQNRHSMVPSRLFSVPSFAVATRERSQKDQQLLQDNECITISFYTHYFQYYGH
ncbi:uncharacterized protein [Montipora capricornis]|uniref:uncharacterized protein n=1 Tax=Montipora capricornis TaxID=246305 RepID=UPI0035F1AB63